jgi:septum formation protein
MAKTVLKQNKKIILASASPRRRELLGNLGVDFECASSDVSEMPLVQDKGNVVVMYNALQKAKSVEIAENGEFAVLGADTAVYLDGKGFGKPKNKEEAVSFLRELSGKAHRVYTGIALVCGKTEVAKVVETTVRFRELSDSEIFAYVESGSPLDKAGAYGIQDFGGVFVAEIRGDYFNVVGLPVADVYNLLLEHKVIEYVEE